MSTSFPKPTPKPKRILPRMSIHLAREAALKMAPAMKNVDAMKIVGRRPSALQAFDAKKLATSAATYREDVKSCSIWSSYLQ